MSTATSTTTDTKTGPVCQEPECGAPVFSKGLCSKHYQKERRAGAFKAPVTEKSARAATSKPRGKSRFSQAEQVAAMRQDAARAGASRATRMKLLAPPHTVVEDGSTSSVYASDEPLDDLTLKPAIFANVTEVEWKRMHALCTFFGKDPRDLAAELVLTWLGDISKKLADAQVTI